MFSYEGCDILRRFIEQADDLLCVIMTQFVQAGYRKKVVKKSNKKAGEAYRFLLRPIISEKATVGAADGKYTFEVSMDANKVAIKKAVQEVYGVEPADVNIMNKRGKTVRFGRKHGRTKNIKKAVVTLRKGDSIKLYEGI